MVNRCCYYSNSPIELIGWFVIVNIVFFNVINTLYCNNTFISVLVSTVNKVRV